VQAGRTRPGSSPVGCGIDVQAAPRTAGLRRGSADGHLPPERHASGPTSRALGDLRPWRHAHHGPGGALERTGGDGKPVSHVLRAPVAVL
jgi:hypothetical protein